MDTPKTLKEYKQFFDENGIKYFKGATLKQLKEKYKEVVDGNINTDEKHQGGVSIEQAIDEDAKIFLTAEELENLKKQIEDEVRSKIISEKEDNEKSADEIAEEKWKNASKLVRCRVSSNNPTRKDWAGEIIRIGNDKHQLPAYFVHNDSSIIWHYPEMLVKYLEESKITIFRKKKSKDGFDMDVPELINQYNVQRLPPLTKEEFEKLREESIIRRKPREESEGIFQ